MTLGASAPYADFLAAKTRRFRASGLDLPISRTLPELFEFQRDVVLWALRKGRACIFADCGLGKTIMQLDWARNIHGDALILAPLAVAEQTAREAKRFGVDAAVVTSDSDIRPGVVSITNYEKLDRFDAGRFHGVVLDESSILKSYTGAYRNRIISSFAETPFKLACTATPAPNDFMELGNHAEFVGAMTRPEMLSMFFVHDGSSTQDWRLKGHARHEFWRWVASWAVLFNRPSDMGYDDDGFVLPRLDYVEHLVDSPTVSDSLFPNHASLSLMDRRGARRDSIEGRCEQAARLVNESTEPWVVWCDLNAESERLSDLIQDSIQVTGSDDDAHKRDAMIGFSEGRFRVIVTKPRIAGFGMNWQHCARMAFVGLSDSYEALYQATRRCWRFGQERDVEAHIITSEAEGAVLSNVKRKEKDHREMQAQLSTIARECFDMED